RPVLLFDQAGGEVVEEDDQRAFALLEQAELLELRHDVFHLLVVRALALERVELHAEAVVRLLELPQRELPEPAPELHLFLPPLFESEKGGARLLVQGGFIFRLIVEPHVKAEQVGERRPVEVDVAAPPPVGHDELSNLGAPVAQVIYADDAVPYELEDSI